MKAVNSIELIETLEQKVENHIQIAVKIFQNLSTDVLLQPSAFGGWSIAQCIAHLNSYGNFYLPHIKKSLVVNNDLPYNSTFKSGWLGNYFTQIDRKSVV